MRREAMPVQKLSRLAMSPRSPSNSTTPTSRRSTSGSAKGTSRPRRSSSASSASCAAARSSFRPPSPAHRVPAARPAHDAGVHVEGLDDVMVRLSRCCTPVPGDEIMGFVTRGRGVSVHRTDCANAVSLRSQADRVIEVEWDNDAPGNYMVSVEVEALDRSRLFRDVADVLSEHHVNILSCTSQTTSRPDRTPAVRVRAGRSRATSTRSSPRSNGSVRSTRHHGCSPATSRSAASSPIGAARVRDARDFASSPTPRNADRRARARADSLHRATDRAAGCGMQAARSRIRVHVRPTRLHDRRGRRRDHRTPGLVPGRGRCCSRTRSSSPATPATASWPRTSRLGRSRTVRGQAADPDSVHHRSRREQTVTTPPDGERAPVHGDPGHAVRRAELDHERLRQRGVDHRPDHAGQRVGDVAGHGRTEPVTRSTTLAPPAGAYSASTGSIAAKVLDSAGRGARQRQRPDRRVRRPLTQQTTTEGCAYFAFSTPGAYTVERDRGHRCG